MSEPRRMCAIRLRDGLFYYVGTMCFPYGPKSEVEAGNGRMLRLAVTEADDA